MPTCPYTCCSPRHSYNPASFQIRSRYSMPAPAPVSSQIVPIRNNTYYRTPNKSLQSLYTFGQRSSIADENNNALRFGSLKISEERKSPYYYNELTRLHALSQQPKQQFIPLTNPIQLSNHFNNIITHHNTNSTNDDEINRINENNS